MKFLQDYTIVIRHGKLIGFYIPVEQSDEMEVKQALQRLSQTVETAIAESDMDEIALSRALDLSQKE
jgi:hypothetical protein